MMWFSANQLATLQLSGLPSTERGMSKFAIRYGWRDARGLDGQPLAIQKADKKGGWHYHISLLPPAAQTQIKARQGVGAEQINGLGDTPAPVDKASKRDHRVALVNAWLVYRQSGGTQADFCRDYKARALSGIDDCVYAAVESFTVRTLQLWVSAAQTGGVDGLLDRRGRPQKGRVIDRAFGGKLARKVESWVVKESFLTARQIRDFVMVDFGETVEIACDETGEIETRPMPALREFARYIAAFKRDKASLIAEMTNPDLYRGKYAPAIGRADDDVTVPNQLWEIDASPADALLAPGPDTEGGRWSLYAVQDVATRRIKAVLTKTPRTQAALHLIRLAIEDWGIPQFLRTDNGSDFVSHQMKTALRGLGISHDICPPFSPEKKPFVERVIGTLQRDFMREQKGFIGHSVADRKVIEARKTFAARLGDSGDNAFCVDLDARALQRKMDLWCADLYGNSPHSGLGGRTPNEVWAESGAAVYKVAESRALALLMSPVATGGGLRKVGRKGVRVGSGYYYSPALLIGHQVFVRYDPADDCRIAVFSADQSSFLDFAVSLDGLSPAERQALAKTAKRAAQPERRAAMYAARAKAKAGNVTRLPGPEHLHSTPQIEAAETAFNGPLNSSEKPLDAEQQARREAIVLELAEAKRPAPRPETAEDRYSGEVFTDARDVDIDHVVPLYEAHLSGGAAWTRKQKRTFANDPENLLIVDKGLNRAKGAKDPARWLDVRPAYRCVYLKKWATIKTRYGLTADEREKGFIAEKMKNC